jgi:hypothetical protein
VPWNWFQVHIEFRRQCLEMTVDKLLEQFVLNKYTGLEKPGKFIFLLYVSFFISPWPARTRPQFPFLYHLDLLEPDHNFLLTYDVFMLKLTQLSCLWNVTGVFGAWLSIPVWKVGHSWHSLWILWLNSLKIFISR